MRPTFCALVIGALFVAIPAHAAAEPSEADKARAARVKAQTDAEAAEAKLATDAMTKLTAAEAAALADKQAKDKAAKDFAGLSLGAGLSVTFDIGHNARVAEAVLVGPTNIVRVSKRENVRARVMFESHYFFVPDSCWFNVADGGCGFGPFVAIQPGTDDVIEAVAFGAMIGFRRVESETQSFNIGVGFVFDPKTRILGEGIVKDTPLPAGETEIRYEEREQKGIVVITSFSF